MIDRYAPSPTSDLHIGNLRTALAGWLLTRAAGGEWKMRIEDLDEARVAAAPGVAEQQLQDLTDLGLTWDGEIMWQSRRQAAYDAALAQLADQTYKCFCTRKEIAEASSAPHDGYRPYPGTCASLSPEEVADKELTRSPALRIRSHGASFTIDDLHVGNYTDIVDDFVLVRGDGAYAYNFAVVVDDIAQGVTQITRGADLLSSAPRQAWLTSVLGAEPATYAHIGLVTNEDGKRLAKRDGDVTLTDLREQGWETADVLAYLSQSLGLGESRSAEEALGKLPPSDQFFAPVTWNG